MKTLLFAVLPFLAGCLSSPQVENPPMRPGGPNWEEVDKTVQRVKEREQGKPRLVETARTQDEGFNRMSDDDYAAELAAARSEVKKANPKMSEDEVEKEATKRADKAKSDYEQTYFRSASSTYELKKP